MSVQPGSPIPLRLQITDGTTGLFVRADVFFLGGDVYASAVPLNHLSNGLYIPAAPVNMPGQPVVAQYRPFLDSARTVIAPYQIVEEHFALAVSASDTTFIYNISGGGLSDSDTAAVVKIDKLQAIVSTHGLSDSDTAAVVKIDKLQAIAVSTHGGLSDSDATAVVKIDKLQAIAASARSIAIVTDPVL